ncbi:MAG: isoprenyl transferase [Coriobacteriia bacterium]|nr:isoprenyl transferase [Coriobacteriia bacterium]
MKPPTTDSRRAFFADTPGSTLLSSLDEERLPRHVAVIMDGNGRWAASRGLPRLAGHRAGAKAVKETIAAALEIGLEVLTIYSFSSENWSRPEEEVSGLMDLFVEVLQRELDNLQQRGVRVVVAGQRDGLPKHTRAAFDACERDTASNTTMTLVVALNYGGRQEIIDAVRAVGSACANGTMLVDDIDEHVFASHLYTAGLPDPDLVIRTSGEMRVSNFLLWQIAYAELWVTETLWPDFDRHELLRGVVEFQGRVRRFGGSE